MQKRTWKKLRHRFPKLLALAFAAIILLRPLIFAASVQATSPAIVIAAETKPTPESKPTESKPEEKPEEPLIPVKSPDQIEVEKKLAEADRLLLTGDKAAAEKLYREAKTPFQGASDATPQEILLDPAQLSPAGKVYWREAEAGFAQNLETRIMVPLELLAQKYPQFIPGQLRYAEALEKFGKKEKALAVLDRAATLFPNQPELVKARIAALGKSEQWIDASIAARQFALLNPDHPQVAEFTQLAEANLKRYKSELRKNLRGNLVGNIITGALGYALTGSLFGPLNAVQNTALLLRGESAVGERVVKQAKRVLDLSEDKEINEYVNALGAKLVNAAGRNDFKYEFYVVLDDKLNAFALPGGKVFINAGAIAKANSEAELVGLLGHELAHAVLSHSFQLISDGSLTANITQFIPYVGGLISDISSLSYGREMERQADIFGTRLLVSTGYAADGLRNLMVTLRKLDEEKKRTAPPAWLTSHPLPGDRVSYLESLITNTGYNRYTYEGIERHAAIQARVVQAMKEYKESEKYKKKKRAMES
jgi:Zn-dependent protease with chaperone function